MPWQHSLDKHPSLKNEITIDASYNFRFKGVKIFENILIYKYLI